MGTPPLPVTAVALRDLQWGQGLCLCFTTSALAKLARGRNYKRV